LRESRGARCYGAKASVQEFLLNQRTNLLRCVVSSILLLLATAAVRAHHSGAMFDAQKTITLRGTVKALLWSNPHCWIQLLVPKDGSTQEWSVQMGSTTELYRSGWRPSTLQTGQKVTVVVHP
jgi:Family of unknown function (DUF6152)